MRPKRTALLAGTALLAMSAMGSSIAGVVYEHNPESNSNLISHHMTGGPVLADDFDPSKGGRVIGAEWWGSRAGSSQWELTLHFGHIGASGSGEPAAIPAATGGRKYFVNAVGDDLDNDGIFHYSTALPGDFSVNGGPLPFGGEYWFSIANVSDGWTWALAGAGPTIGDEHWHAVRSTGALCGDGGPHCGPWSEIEGRDLAFRLTVPEPEVPAMLALSLLAATLVRRRSR